MRTTVELDDDTAQAVQQLRQEQGRGVSEAVNELIRRGLLARPHAHRFEPRTRSLGIRIDVSNVADALHLLEGEDAR
ncbi:MAG: ribbon-helix-helix protein, CopG family [Pseudonocardiales bacterium]